MDSDLIREGGGDDSVRIDCSEAEGGDGGDMKGINWLFLRAVRVGLKLSDSGSAVYEEMVLGSFCSISGLNEGGGGGGGGGGCKRMPAD